MAYKNKEDQAKAARKFYLKNKDKMISEGEQDIKNGQTYSLEQAKELMKKWNP